MVFSQKAFVVIEAFALQIADLNGKSDPYAVVEVVDNSNHRSVLQQLETLAVAPEKENGSLQRPLRYETSVAHKTLFPQWNQTFTL